MASAVILALVGLTSLVAYLVGQRGLRLNPRDLGLASRRMLECLGIAVVFFVVNLTTGIIGVLAIRPLMKEFVPVYLLDVPTIGIISLLQGLTFQWWWESR